ncbi:MAG: flagellar hook-basal body complex protein FliE [Lachnospiraceae bacterium]|nr:flagellar hook-basal body complex protein FliE [Lachnospiraceae bacterium]
MDVLGADLVTNGLSGISPYSDSDAKVYKDNNTAFNSLLNSAITMYQEADTYQRKAEQAEMNFAMGYSTSTHDLALAQQKANLSLQYTVRVTNSVLDAYKELLNMQL